MKILMLGWELPPLYVGGIGLVCYELLKEFSNKDIEVTFVMPLGPEEGLSSDYANIIIAEHCVVSKKFKIKKIKIPCLAKPYQSPLEYIDEYKRFSKLFSSRNELNLYGSNLFQEVDLFAKRLYLIADKLDFDIIYAHDWMTFPAAIGVKHKTGKPLIVHVHNTIFDRYLGNASKIERDIEFNGLNQADKVIAISNYVKSRLIDKYRINSSKIVVVHNARNTYFDSINSYQKFSIGNKKVVLFAGRITIQKGPEYFLYAAKKVLEKRKDVVFVMAGSGDMLSRMIDLSASLGIAKNVLFTGRYNYEQIVSLYARADCFVMPSVSEPFGIVPLEAMANYAPCIISKQSGVSEVVKNVLKVDFWDVDEMANKILSVLSYKTLKKQLSVYGKREVDSLTWDKQVDKIIDVFRSVIR